jgi:hypothetical protein
VTCAWSVLGQMNFCIHIHMDQVKTHPVHLSNWADLTKNLQNFGRNSNLDISRLASPGSFIFSQCIRNLIKLVVSNSHVNQTKKKKYFAATCDIPSLDVSSVSQQAGWPVHGVLLVKRIFAFKFTWTRSRHIQCILPIEQMWLKICKILAGSQTWISQD